MTGNEAVLAAALALGPAALYQGLTVRRYRMEAARLAEGRNLRFAVAADLHSKAFGKDQRKLLRLLERQCPDYILMPGDIVDERLSPVPAWQFLRGAARIAPCFYAPGNHEYRTLRMPWVLDRIGRCGVTALADRYVTVDTKAGPVVIAGCEDPEKTGREDASYGQVYAMRRAFAPLEGERAFRVLLAHRPERWETYRSMGFDLAVSGHAHGGQVRVPFLLNGLYAPHQGLFPPYAGGLYEHGPMIHVVSRGLSGYPRLPRVFNPPELVVIDIVGSGRIPS